MTPANSKLRETQFRFAGHIRDPEHQSRPADVEERRMAIYRDLFFNNVAGLIGNNFPVLKKLYGEGDWRALIRHFMVQHRAHTPLFPELPREFLRFIEQDRGIDRGDPPFLLELAHYEWVELALALDEAEIDTVEVATDGDLLIGSPVLSPLAWLLSYRFPVHRIRPSYRPKIAPAEETHLVVYRTASDDIRFMELNPVSARLVLLLRDQPGLSGRHYLEQIATELGVDDSDRIVAAGRKILEDLRQRQVVLGTN